VYKNRKIVTHKIVIIPKGESTEDAIAAGVSNGKMMYKTKIINSPISRGGIDLKESNNFIISYIYILYAEKNRTLEKIDFSK